MVCQRSSHAGTPPVGSPVKHSTRDAAAVPASPATMYKELKQEADLLEQTVALPSEEELLTGPFGLDVVPGAHTPQQLTDVQSTRRALWLLSRRRVACDAVLPGGIYEQMRAEMVAIKAELKARERLIADKDAALMMYQKQTQNHERSKQSQQVCSGSAKPHVCTSPQIATHDHDEIGTERRTAWTAQRVYDKELNELKREIQVLRDGQQDRSSTPVKRASMRF
jgi:hypothetical protein